MKDFEYCEPECKDKKPLDCGCKLKRPCRCGGTCFKEPEMKRTNCCPKHCCQDHCRCCCTCRATCCDRNPCGCRA